LAPLLPNRRLRRAFPKPLLEEVPVSRKSSTYSGNSNATAEQTPGGVVDGGCKFASRLTTAGEALRHCSRLLLGPRTHRCHRSTSGWLSLFAASASSSESTTPSTPAANGAVGLLQLGLPAEYRPYIITVSTSIGVPSN